MNRAAARSTAGPSKTTQGKRVNPVKLKLPDGSFRAYLFDCDGTIADSMPLHYLAWQKALGEWNCIFDEDLFYSWGGRPTVEIVARLNRNQGLNMPVEDVAIQKENY